MLKLAAFALALLPALARADAVRVDETPTHFVLSNGTIVARVSKTNGDLLSLTFRGTELLTDKSGRAGAYWSHDASGGVETIARVTIDPAATNGDRAEVSVKGVSGGKKMGRPAGGAADGDFPADVEIRYALGRDDSGVYAYCILDHRPEYPAGVIGEARYCAKLAATFDWMHVDPNRNKYYPREEPGEDKYVYTAVQSENPAYGWSSSTAGVGLFLINPSMEYMGGGPTKVEFLCHRDTTPVQAPCILNYWRSSHYGGAAVAVAAGERWTKVIGPFLLYANASPAGAPADPQAMYRDAKAQFERERDRWPYAWVRADAYPLADARVTVRGRLNLVDPLASSGFTGTVTVGLTGPEFTIPTTNPAVAPARTIGWQKDAKQYQYWTTARDPAGAFAVPHVRPGRYTLRAFADGVLGEFARADVDVPGDARELDLGAIDWTPVRRGRTLWEIGRPDRTAREFAGGDAYFLPDAQLRYPKLFPDDVRFVVGTSDVAKDWYFEHIPHNVDPDAHVRPFRGVVSKPGNATPYRISFALPDAVAGTATLRFAFCTASARTLDVDVNGVRAGQLENLAEHRDSTIVRHNIQGIWFERELAFDATLLKTGENAITLTVPAGSLNDGVIYDCVRLELDEAKAQR